MKQAVIWPVPVIEFLQLNQHVDSRPVTVVFTRSAWSAVAQFLSLNVVSWIEVQEATLPDWETKKKHVRGEAIYAVGGGLSVDAAKYFAAHHALPLISIPTALSVDAFFTWASGYRQDGCVRYVETTIPERILLDWDVIRSGPASIRLAGICDVLSIATGRWDWRFAEQQGESSEGIHYIGWADEIAKTLLDATLGCAGAAGQGDSGAMKTMLDCLLLEVQLCNQIGHSRPEEGSEHYFAYSVETMMGKGLPHGDLVGPGILLAALLQDQDTRPLRDALLACHIPLDKIPPDVIRKTLTQLPAYCEAHRLPYGIAHTITPSDAERASKTYQTLLA